MENYTGFEIAVIGISARFPGAKNKEEFWDNLSKGVESIEFFSEEELLREGEEISRIKDPAYVNANGYLKNKENFDSAFFGYTPDEAALMDPQTRILHECVWEAIEDAGYNVHHCKSRIGLFSGATTNTNWVNYASIKNFEKLVDPYTLMHLSDVNFSNTKISYLLNLRGPSVTVHTACSTSLVAVHQACNSLLLGECEMAAAGGITISNYSKRGYLYREGMILSANGHCHTFDESASGTVGGEGAGIVLLKRLKRAIEDNDHIYAIIKGTGVNNDGNGKVGYTAPSVDGQTHAIMMARKMAKVPAASITYVEAHGTATKLGDPVEVEALIRAFGASEEKYCALGSVKTNIGHADCAAGIAGFIKTVLSVKNRQIPPSLNFKHPNPRIDFSNSPFYVNTALKDWINDKYPLRAGVSSFGIGGTNAHVILEEAPARMPSSESRPCQLLVFSAKTETALERNIRDVVRYIEAHDDIGLPDLAYTLQLGRATFSYRKMFVCSGTRDALSVLSVKTHATVSGNMTKPALVFMFPGQGSQYINMCYDLYTGEADFKVEVDNCLAIVQRVSGMNLKQVIFQQGETNGHSEINHTRFTQPALFVIEYALAQWLIKRGIRPAAMIGHSIGEYVAACISGVFTLEDALSMVLKRGALMQEAKKGIMLSISIPEAKLIPLIENRLGLSLAAVNSSEHCVVSGEEKTVLDFQSVLEKTGVKSKVIRTSHAFHSCMMDEILDEFEREVSAYKINPIRIPFISNLTGKMATDDEISSPKYWSRHLRETVRFSDGVDELSSAKKNVFVEVGPGSALSTFVRSKNTGDHKCKVTPLIRRADEKGSDVYHLMSAIGNLWLTGVEPDWNSFYENEVRHRIPAPTYAFDETRYPVKVDSFQLISGMLADGSSRKKDISGWYYLPAWKLSPAFRQTGTSKRSCYLIFSDSMGVGDGLHQKLTGNGEKVIRIRKGDDTVESAISYVINPDNDDSYARLFEGLMTQGMIPDTIVHCWNIDDVAEGDILSRGFLHYCNILYFSLVNIIKAARKYGGLQNKRFIVLTNGIHNVLDGEPAHPIKSLVTGLLKIIPQEYPSVQCKHIDIPLTGPYHDQLVEQLLHETVYSKDGGIVAFRNSHRWNLVYDKVAPPASDGLTSFRQQGVYLITGGLGDLGFCLAQNLVKRYNAKLILLGRTELPPEENWNRILANRESSEKVLQLLERINTLKVHGKAIHYHACNIADRGNLAEIVEKSEKILGPVNGIIHAAGIARAGLKKTVTELSTDDLFIHCETKIHALNSLKFVFGNKPLDFCILTSSLSSILGGLGFGPYASANTYMDNFVRLRRNGGDLSNWISVNLDGLNFTELPSVGIDKGELFSLFETIVFMKEVPQVVVSPTDLGKRLDNWIRFVQKDDTVGETAIENRAYEGRPGRGAENALSSLEENLLEIWQHFFGKMNIGADDNFFEIGGDSLKALTMIERLRSRLKIEISVKDFFEYSTVKELAGYIKSNQADKERGSDPVSIPKVEKRQYYPASSAQERMLYEQMSYDKSVLNNISKIFAIGEDMDLARLEMTFRLLVNRHEALRTSIELDGGNIVQRVHENIPFNLSVLDSGRYETVTEAFNDFNCPFDLSKPPLLRCGILKHKRHGNFLLVSSHHVVCDRISMNILMTDFINVYSGGDLQPLDFRYADYSFWQKNQNAYLVKQREFWMKQLSGYLPGVNLPTIRDRHTVNIYQGERCIHVFSETLTQAAKRLAAQENVSDFMLMLAVFYVFLNKVSGEKDLIVGTDAVGTTRHEFNNTVGSFINALPLRLTMQDGITFPDLLVKVRTCVLEALENQDFQYDRMNSLRDHHDAQQIIDVYFSYTNKLDNEPKFIELGFLPFEVDKTSITTRYELEVNLFEEKGKFNLTFFYSTSLYDAETIALFMKYFFFILTAVLENNNIALEDVKLEHAMNQLMQY